MQAHVKMWFLSGAFERVDAENGRLQELATIYAEAETNDRVVAAELHREDGSVAASFDHRTTAVCGRRINPTVLLDPGAADAQCVRAVGHSGRHRNFVAKPRPYDNQPGQFVWGDNECAPEVALEPKLCGECGRRNHKLDCSRRRLAPLT